MRSFTDQDPNDGFEAGSEQSENSGVGLYNNGWQNSRAKDANDGAWHHVAWVLKMA